MEVHPDSSILLVRFLEIVGGFRTLSLLIVEMVASDWNRVVNDMKADYERTRVIFTYSLNI
jgi:hypothetical protein